MKLEHLFCEAITKREGIVNDPEAMRGLLSATLEGHLCVSGVALEGPIESAAGVVSFEKYAFLEAAIAEAFIRLTRRETMRWICGELHPSLTEEQQAAIHAGCTHSLLFLTGGPGTGKTYTIAQMLTAFEACGAERIAICAPTGKAAAHLLSGIQNTLPSSSSLNYQAGTLHAILEVRSSYDALNKELYVGADVLVVDECSMIDVSMWYALLRAIGGKTKVIFVGDTNQLPPVETGSIFTHLCRYMADHHKERCAHLSRCLRSESVEILALAEAVHAQDSARVHALLSAGNTIGFTQTISFPPFPKEASPEEAMQHASTFRILSARKEGEHGVAALNGRFSAQYARGDVWIEPIIVTKTSKELGLYNGENGIAYRYRQTPEKDIAYFNGAEGIVSFPLSLLPKHELAYALSIHKSQGSEYAHVTLVLPDGSELFGKELLYTGITRAKKEVRVYGKEETLIRCIDHQVQRQSRLLERLHALEG